MDITHLDSLHFIKLKTAEGLLVLTFDEYKNALRRGESINKNRRLSRIRKQTELKGSARWHLHRLKTGLQKLLTN